MVVNKIYYFKNKVSNTLPLFLDEALVAEDIEELGYLVSNNVYDMEDQLQDYNESVLPYISDPE